LNKPVIGLTGPTGAGKSTVAAVFRELGCAVIDADLLARDAVQNPECLEALCREFGSDLVSADGSLDRRLLASRAFAGPERTERLNRITHPAIRKETVRQIAELRNSGAKAVVFDVPLLFESGADALCDRTIAVTAPPGVRLKRIMKRDGITEKAARERMNAQHPNRFYEMRAGYVLNGGMKLDMLRDAAVRLLKQILGEENEIL
jgi:dephospho-CoA kinase